MKEEYFDQVIFDITKLCNDLRNERVNTERDLYAYLNNLTDTTLNTVCALMDFGRMYGCSTLPINLEKIFNKYYLPYWFDSNKSKAKDMTVEYLVDKYFVLPKYLCRAQYLLFHSKNYNIPLTDDCGGYLYVDETDGIIQVGYDEYELNLKCLKCKSRVTKVVSRDFLTRRI